MTSTPYQTARADQYRAATRDANHTVRLAATDHRTRANVVADRWLETAARRLTRTLRRGAQTCPHIGDSPTVAYAAAWAPGTLACPTCAPVLFIVPPEQETACDRCGRIADAIGNGLTAIGPVLYLFGLCEPCATATGLGQ